MENFRQCLSRINSAENYQKFLHAGFQVLFRDETRSVAETLRLAERCFHLPETAP